MDFAQMHSALERAGVNFEQGLSEQECREIEDAYAFCFPPDLREFLMYALPVSKGWLDWRRAGERHVRERLEWPYDGICFDIEHAGFWLEEWGERPGELKESFAMAKRFVDAAPKLIPIFAHRYLPDRPSEPGNPVLSVWQTDIIYYGSNLPEYLNNEFLVSAEFRITEPLRAIELWTRIIDCSSGP